MTEAIISNIERLVADAEVLRDADRNESSVLLLIFAFEQVGKVLMKMDKKKGRGNHKAKQRAAVGHLLGVMALEALNDAGYEFIPNRPPNMEPVDSIKMGTSDHDEMVKSMERLIDSDGAFSLANSAYGSAMYDARNWLMYSDGKACDQAEIKELQNALFLAIPRLLHWAGRIEDGSAFKKQQSVDLR